MSALANPSYNYRTAKGIAEEFSLVKSIVDAFINAQDKVIVKGPMKDKEQSYTLKERAPGWFVSLPGVGWVKQALLSGSPTIG